MRMMRLHEEIAQGNYPNCSKLARDLEVAPKTIQRDIDFMRDQLGLPIEYDERSYGFYYTETVTHFPTVQVSEGELVALFVAQKALSQYRGTVFERPLAAAFEKLTKGLREQVSFEMGHWDASFSFRSTGTALTDLELFESLSKAVVHSREVIFEYRKLDSQAPEKRRVWPYHLASVDNQWYLFGHDVERDGMRTFALPRIGKAEVTGARFKQRKDFSLAKMLRHSFGVFSGEETYEVRVEFRSWAARMVKEKQWHPSQKLVDKGDGRVELMLVLGSLYEIKRWILSWGEFARVLGPPELVESVRQSALEMMKNLAEDKEEREDRKVLA